MKEFRKAVFKTLEFDPADSCVKGGRSCFMTYSIIHQIDQLVYELYGLTAEEIKIVEGDKD